MLNKAICEKCLENFYKKLLRQGLVSKAVGNSAWDGYDENRWRLGLVNCPNLENKAAWWTTRNIDILPPSYCPHKFEHAICMGVKHVE